MRSAPTALAPARAQWRLDAAPLRVTTDRLPGNVGLLSLAGYLNGHGGHQVAQAAGQLLQLGCPTILIDFRGTRLVNHRGLWPLVDLLQSSEPRVSFLNLSPTVERIFRIVGLLPSPERER